MTERLINKGTKGEFWVSDTDCTRAKGKLQAVMEKLYKYETAEDKGRLVVLPCDTVYFIWNKSSGISHVRAKSILDLSLREILGIDKDGRYWSVKEEAEKALKEMKKNE